MSDSKNTIYINFWDISRVIYFGGTFVASNMYIRKARLKIDEANIHIKLEKDWHYKSRK